MYYPFPHLYSSTVGLGVRVLARLVSCLRHECTPQPQFHFLPQASWMLRRPCPLACHLPSFASPTTPMLRWSGC